MKNGLIEIRTVATQGKGQLSFFEANVDIPFSIRRVYYIYDVPQGEKRGGHAHRNLYQLLICPRGSIEVTLNDGSSESRYVLDDPSKGLLVSNMTWHDMVWLEADSVLMVAASEHYDESDYIRDFDAFLKCATALRSESGSH